MFDFMGMENNYEHRKVNRYTNGGILVSTARVTDGAKPFETAIEHPLYNSGTMIIVEAYDTLEQAKAGHSKWEKAITSNEPPPYLIDCCNSEIGSLYKAFGGKTKHMRKSKKTFLKKAKS